jgi:hypothetical protein
MNAEPPSRPNRRWRGLAIALGWVVVSVAIVFGDSIVAEWHARDAEREITDLASRIPLNATSEQVAVAFARGNYDYLKLRTHDTWDQWYFHTPYRFGATDWILKVAFAEGRVVEVRVGTSDSMGRRPDGAPPDRRVP